ncbi:MAG: type II toxin-antitoxin system VapC family toxin [bacterium]
MFLFDTDVITNIFKPKPSRYLVERLKNLPREDQFVSTITIAEIVYGAMKSTRPEYHLFNLKNLILPTVTIVSFNSEAAFYCGEIRAELEKQGIPISFADLQIASIAISHKLTLITGNTKHFQRISTLQSENWIK